MEIDPTDHSVWYSIGQLSRKLKNLRFARLAYEKGMLANSTGKNVLDTIRDQLTPIQWKCLEGICTVSGRFTFLHTILTVVYRYYMISVTFTRVVIM